jgi:serine/threonine-protein kinase RsbW
MDVVDRVLRIRIRDEGEGFDPEKVEDPLAPENRFKTSGRGIFYMKTFMDEVRFQRAAGGGMEIYLTKNLASGGKEKEDKGS